MNGKNYIQFILSQKKTLSAFFIATICVLYFYLIPVTQPDYYKFLQPWLRAITSSDGLEVFRTDFTNYTGGYVTVLWLMHFFQPILSEIVVIKITAIIGSVACALSVAYALDAMGWGNWGKYNAALGFLLLPSVWMNGVAWGQADAFYTTFLILSFASITKDQAFRAMILFCIAVSFKLQAILFAPFLLGYLLRRPSIIVAMIFVMPFTYLAVNALYLLSGRPILDVFSIYLQQAKTYNLLSMNAPNLWLIADSYLDVDFLAKNFHSIVLYGTAFSTIIAVILILRVRKLTLEDNNALLFWAAFTLIVLPFLLPKMHERFFFSAEVFGYLLALNVSRFIRPTIFIQISALLMYSMYHDTIGLRGLIGWPNVALFGILFMTATVLILFKDRKFFENGTIQKY
jgi:Gpi18-like mannosyltransferase